METFCTILLWVCIPYSSMNTSIIPSPAVGGKESYSLNIYDIQNQFIGWSNTTAAIHHLCKMIAEGGYYLRTTFIAM